MTTTELIQVLKLDNGTELPLVGTPQESLDHYSGTYPELTTATVGEATPDTKSNKLIYKVSKTLGTKG